MKYEEGCNFTPACEPFSYLWMKTINLSWGTFWGQLYCMLSGNKGLDWLSEWMSDSQKWVRSLCQLWYIPWNVHTIGHVTHPGGHSLYCRQVTVNHLNTLSPRQNGRHFADYISKCVFLYENVWISIKISLKFIPKGPINNIPALVQIMAWRRPGDKPLSEPMMVRLPTYICVTRPQWVKVGNHRWNLWVPGLQMSCTDLPTGQDTTKVLSSMTALSHAFFVSLYLAVVILSILLLICVIYLPISFRLASLIQRRHLL